MPYLTDETHHAGSLLGGLDLERLRHTVRSGATLSLDRRLEHLAALRRLVVEHEEEITAAVTAEDCQADQLDTLNSGTLTVATDSPAFPPYFEDDDPTNGEGFESAVGYAIADQLGFSADQVEWVARTEADEANLMVAVDGVRGPGRR